MQKLSDIDLINNPYDSQEHDPAATLSVIAMNDDGTVDFELSGFKNLSEYIDHAELKLYLGETVTEGEEETIRELETLSEVTMTEAGDKTYTASLSIEGHSPEELCASATVFTKSGAEYRVYDKKDLRTMVTDMDLYLKICSELLATGDYTLVITAKDEPTSGLTESVKKGLRDLGLQQDLTDQFRCSYLAVVGPDGVVIEQFSPDELLKYEGVFPDGVKYWINSAGGNARDNEGRVWIGTYQWTSQEAVNRRGLNMVLYDHANSRIIDSVDFDTFELKENGRYRVLRNANKNTD